MTIRLSISVAALAGTFLFADTALARIFQIWTEAVQLEANIRPGSEGSDPTWLAVYNGTLYFSAKGDDQGVELWSYDGGSAARVSNISPGSGDSFPAWLTVYDGALYFSASDSPLNAELWRFDGSNSSLVADIRPGPTGSHPGGLTVFDGALYFSAYDGNGRRRLWRYDGAAATIMSGTEDVSKVQELTVHDGYLWFLAQTSGENFGRIWRTDGQDTQSIALIDSLNLSEHSELVSAGPNLYASLRDSNYGRELWRVTINGLLVEDIFPGENSSNPRALTWFDNKMYMSARIHEPGSGAIYGTELVRFDGMEAELVHDIFNVLNGSSCPAWMTEFLNALYFSADNVVGRGCPSAVTDAESAWTGRELYKHDPEKNTTILLKDINESESSSPFNGSSNPRWFTHGPPAALSATLYFSADDGVNGRELWSIRRTRTRIEVLLYPQWTPAEMINPWEWQAELRTEDIEVDVAMAAFLLTPDGRARFFDRVDVNLPRGQEHSERIVTGHGMGTESGIVTLAVAVFDKQRGDLIGIETASVGIDERVDEKIQAEMHRRATSVLRSLSLKTLTELEPGSILTAEPERASKGRIP
jgi:ELWxxDGT repeat protein